MIVISTTPGRESWLRDCLESIKRPVIVISNFNYELGKIKFIYENTNLSFFLLLQDSVIVKNDKFFDLMFEAAGMGSAAVTNDPHIFGMYMGVYTRQTLAKTGIPNCNSKKEAIEYEISWHERYVNFEPTLPVVFPELNDSRAAKKELRHGRLNLVLENDYLIKYKGNWGQKPALD